MRISPIILFSVDFIIYAIFDEDLSQDLSARQWNHSQKRLSKTLLLGKLQDWLKVSS